MKKERERFLTDLQKMFVGDSNRSIFKNFIEYIRFPFFKNFDKDLKVNFNFPITFIVGQNGSGKSSLLHALYGAPEGKSVEEYWYNTALDPIMDLKENRHCFIYSFKTEFTKSNIEVIKTRIKNKEKETGKINPDYWEPSRPIKKYGMAKLPVNADKREATSTRWKLVKREVYLLDFRYSLSAYDKYFYFGSLPNTKTLKSKKDVIRKFASKLRIVFDKNQNYPYHTREASVPIVLTFDERKIISNILGKNYTETKIATHNFYDKNKGFAIRYKTNNIIYSEAYAGSGETAIVRLVHDLMKTEKYSLVLLDEPETSLHPSAQKRLINFILEQTIKKKLQVIISTHSPDIIDGMPKEAIKIFYENQQTGKINILENVYPENAFVHIGRSFSNKKVIIVEDALAKMIVERVMKETHDTELFDVKYFPGGESIIKQQNMNVYSNEDDIKHFIIFDGDKRKKGFDISKISDRDKNISFLGQMIKDIVDQNIKFSIDGGNNEKQKIDLMLKYIKYHYENVFYLPRKIPEEILWDDKILERADITKQEREKIKKEGNIKKKFNLFAKYIFDDDKAEDQKKAYQYFLTRWIKEEDNNYKNIVKILETIKKK